MSQKDDWESEKGEAGGEWTGDSSISAESHIVNSVVIRVDLSWMRV